jgi:5-methylthioadenosine/S-adenosylhomocysteine deaminase
MSELWIGGGTVVTMNAAGDILEDGFVHVKDGRIEGVGVGGKPPKGARLVDGKDCLITPGLVNLHTHSPMTLLRGVADDLPLERWLRDAIWPLEQKFAGEEFAYWGTKLAALEMIRSGTTTFNDMYFFEDQVARAADESGLRAVCGFTLVELSDVDNSSDRLFEKLDAFQETVAKYARVTPAVAPHSVYGVRPSTWEKIVEYAAQKKLRVHVHVCEVQSEVDDCVKAHKKTPVEFFDAIGLFSQCRTIAAHMVILSQKDIHIAGRHRLGVAHNIESNLKLATKISPVVELRDAGARVGLGTDGAASNNNLDLLQEVDTAAKLQSFRLGPGALPAHEAFRLLTIEGAEALGLDGEIGSLEPGKKADLIAVDTSLVHATPFYDAYSHLVYSAGGRDVKHSVVDGKLLMEDYKVLSLDEPAILKEARRWGDKIARNRF